MDLDALKILIDVSKAGSLNAVARTSKRSRATLRRRLEALEASVGLPLLMYEPQGVRLTRAGQLLVHEGPSVLDSVHQLLDRLTAVPSQSAMTLRLLYPVGMPALLRYGILQMVWAELPELSLELRELEDPLAHLDEPFELALHFGPPPTHGQWFGRVVMRNPIGLVAAPRYLEKHGRPADLKEAAAHPLLIWRPAAEALTRAGIDWQANKIRMISNDQLLLRAAAARGDGLLLGGAGPVPDDPGIGRLTDVLPGALDAVIEMRSLSPLPTRMEPGTAALLERLKTALSVLLSTSNGVV